MILFGKNIREVHWTEIAQGAVIGTIVLIVFAVTFIPMVIIGAVYHFAFERKTK